MTLVELSAALTVSAVVSIAALSVAGQFSRRLPVSREAVDNTMTAEPLRRLISQDALHATRFLQTDKGLKFKTTCSLQAPPLPRRHLPSIVEYEIRQADGASMLVRTQRSLVSDDRFEELVAWGVTALYIGDAKAKADSINRWRPMAPGLAVGVQREDDDGPLEFMLTTFSTGG